jgi:hypothetical protein
MLKYREENAGRGYSNKIVDRAYWLEPDTGIDDWVTALEAVTAYE